jgi:hypothetical protein
LEPLKRKEFSKALTTGGATEEEEGEEDEDEVTCEAASCAGGARDSGDRVAAMNIQARRGSGGSRTLGISGPLARQRARD